MKTINQFYALIPRILIILMILIFTACEKTGFDPISELNSEGIDPRSNGQSNKVYVSNVSELYAAVNDPENIGSTIVLLPGTYMLSADYPKGGLLELQHDMSLKGQPGHPELAIIDASNLPLASFFMPAEPPLNPFSYRKGVIRSGNGYNSIQWLTLQNDPGHDIRAFIQTDLVAEGEAKLRVTNSIISGSSIGISIGNWRTYHNNRTLEAEIENNEIFGCGFSFGAAQQIHNTFNVQGASIKVISRGNYLHGNKLGFNVINADNSPDVPNGNNSIYLRSTADRIENNGVGINLQGGLAGSSNNSILFKAYDDVIRNNMNVPAPFPHIIPGGVYIAAGSGRAIDLPGTINDNYVEAHFHDCIIEDNVGDFQMNAFGGRTIYPSSNPVGTFNSTKVYLYGSNADLPVNAINSIPAEPAGTNTIQVIREN